MAKALAGRISLEGGGEALSIGAAGLFLRSLGGNPMDVHLHNSVNLRRYLLRLEGISLKNKLLLLRSNHHRLTRGATNADKRCRMCRPQDGRSVAPRQSISRRGR
jgi:hypothetical protein